MNLFLLLFASFMASAIASANAFEPPHPPGWIDTSTSIVTWIGTVRNCPISGYSWEKANGADFAVYRFTNEFSESVNIGFYLGTNPTLHSKKNGVELSDEVNFSGNKVRWRKTIEDDDHHLAEFQIEQIDIYSHRTILLHFWIGARTASELKKWQDWALCIKIES